MCKIKISKKNCVCIVIIIIITQHAITEMELALGGIIFVSVTPPDKAPPFIIF